MRAWLVVCAALALAPGPATGAAAAHRPAPGPPAALDPQRLERIKSQILAKLGLSTRPTPLGAPPRDVVRQILARAADPQPPHPHHDTDNEHAMREIIAIAHRDLKQIELEENEQISPRVVLPSHALHSDSVTNSQKVEEYTVSTYVVTC